MDRSGQSLRPRPPHELATRRARPAGPLREGPVDLPPGQGGIQSARCALPGRGPPRRPRDGGAVGRVGPQRQGPDPAGAGPARPAGPQRSGPRRGPARGPTARRPQHLGRPDARSTPARPGGGLHPGAGPAHRAGAGSCPGSWARSRAGRRATTPGSSWTGSARPCPAMPSWSRSPGSTSSTSRPRTAGAPGSLRTMPPGCSRRRAGARSACSTSGRPRRSTPPSPPPERRCGPTRRRCATGASPTSSGRPAPRSRRWPGGSSRRCCRTSGRRGAGSSAPMRRSGWSPGRRCRSTAGATPSRTTRSPTSSAAATWSRAAAGRCTARRW